MSIMQQLKLLMTERLAAAADDIFSVVERFLTQYEEELQHREILRSSEAISQNEIDPERPQYVVQVHYDLPVGAAPSTPLLPTADGILNVDREPGPKPPHIKQERDDVWSDPEVEHKPQKLVKDTDIIRLACKTEKQTQDDATHPAETFEDEAQYSNTAPCSSEKPTAESEDSGSPSLCCCQVCGVSFLYHGSLLQHAKVHAKDSLCMCAVCSSQLPSSESLLQHLQTHVKHVCPWCGKTFRNNGNLSVHTRSHTGEKPFSCSTCGKDFSRKFYLDCHMRTHTGEKPYRCSVCGRSFATASTMNRHARRHTGEKPYHCQICFKSFTNSSDMKGHMRRMHTDEKRYSCSTCRKDFSCKNNLEYHMRTHTGEKPYSCSVCGMGFSRSSQFKSHMKRHT